jgi:hypothetical protein
MRTIFSSKCRVKTLPIVFYTLLLFMRTAFIIAATFKYKQSKS